MLMGDELREAVQKAYEESRATAANENPPEIIPAWLATRPAFVDVFSAGRRVGAEEERKGDLPPSYGRK